MARKCNNDYYGISGATPQFGKRWKYLNKEMAVGETGMLPALDCHVIQNFCGVCVGFSSQ